MSSSLSDFQAICNDWGNWFSKKHGTTCRWVKLHAEGWGMDKYQQYKINVRYGNTVYGTQKPLDTPGFVYSQTYTNKTEEEQGNTFTRNESTTATFTWSLTEGIKVGLKVTGSVGLPLVAEGKVEASTEINFSSTQTKTETKTQAWSVSQPVRVPAYTEVDAELSIEQKKYDIDFTSDIIIGGWVAIWNNDKINLGNGKHWLYFFPVSKVLHDKPHRGYTVRGNRVVFKAKGTFKGVQGIGTRVKLSQTSLKHPEKKLARLLAMEPGAEKDGLINPVIGHIPDEVGSNPKD
ncbi:MAG: ETX/MTX2 family pore-forming toxin [Desulfobacterales bacterium]|nr:ETX/MTX2 family pore-forming toxin [Desulfobacterales bacterium]